MRMLVLSKNSVLTAILVCAFSVFIPTGYANALCAAQPWDGQWVHLWGSSSLAELNIEQSCYDQILCGGNGCHSVGSDGYMHAFGHCSPTNCDWGRAHEKDEIGDWVLGIWDFGFKMSWVWAKMSSAYPDKLYVKTFNDYNDGRQDRWDYGYFIHRDNSCIDRCDDRAPGGCWCDSLCDYYGDCCEDKTKQCGP